MSAPHVNLSAAGKAARTHESFVRKVELIEARAASGSIRGGWYPHTLTELAAWEDATLGLTAWVKRNIVSDPKYADLRERYDRAMGRLLARLGKPRRGGDEALRRAEAERNIVVLGQQLLAERLAHQNTKKKLRLALLAKSPHPPVAPKPNLRIVER